MKYKKWTLDQKLEILSSGEEIGVVDTCRKYSVSTGTFYSWKKKYSGMDGDQLKHLKELEEENRHLKTMYADLALDNKMLKDVLSKKW